VTLRRGEVSASFDVQIDGVVDGAPLRLRQTHEVEPTIVPLEEGAERVGVRALWAVSDEAGDGYGEAMQDVYVTRHGEVFLSVAVRIATRAEFVVDHAAIHVELGGVERARAGATEIVAVNGDDTVLITWPVGRGRRYDTLSWQGSCAPFYERWPPLFDQWSLDAATFGWGRFPGAGASVGPVGAGCASAALAWVDGAPVGPAAQIDFRGLVWVALGREPQLRALAAAHEQPLAPRVEGGRFRCYDELDGAYEVAVAGGDDCTIEFPEDPLERPLRVRIFGLDAEGGLATDAGDDLLLLSERGRTDDPLVWVEVDADQRADEALIASRASAAKPTRVSLRARKGLHVAYQRRDPRRRLTIHHPADLDRPIATIDLASLHLAGLRLPGNERPAIHDAPLFWMRYLPKAAMHLANRLQGFELVDASPELIAFVVDSATPDGIVRSRYRVELPFRPDHVEVRIVAELDGAASWGLPTFEFADLFPEDGIDPTAWEYDRIAFVGRDVTRLVDVRRPYPGLDERLAFPVSVLQAMPEGHALPDCGPWPFSDAGAVVFGGSDRGTIIALATNRDPARVEYMATLCEHWADVHFDAAAIGSRPVGSDGFAGAVESPPVPDALRAELTLRVLDPLLVTFDDAVAAARAELADLAPVG
jgi:hypothetical protein